MKSIPLQEVLSVQPEQYGNISKVFCAVSGGRTSAYMAWFLLNHKDMVAEYIGVPEEEIEYKFVFANTGMEHDETYRFLDAVNKNILNNKLVCVESRFDPELGKGTKHIELTIEELMGHRDFRLHSHPFRAEIEKYGIPNTQAAHCTREMKLNSIHHYLRGLWGRDYYTCVGIRSDESRRVAKSATKDKIIYPLIDIASTDKDDVLAFFENFDWDLKIPEYLGNCVTCFKKSDKKLYLAYKEAPEYFDFCLEMEAKHGRAGPRYSPIRSKNSAEEIKNLPDNVFFRGNRSTKDMINLFRLWDEVGANAASMAEDGGCSESCELYQMELI